MKQEVCKVAVHIVTYNSATSISSCLLALQKQSYRDFTLCVVDNNSTDKTVQIIRKSISGGLVKNTHNVGYAAAHNQALRLTKSKYVLTLNPDVLLDVKFIEYMVKAMDNAPVHVGSAAGLLYRVNSLLETSVQIDGAGLYMKRSRRQLLRYEGKNIDELESTQRYIFGPDGAAAFYRRKMLEDIDLGDGMFDEDFFMHKEDVDVCWRAQLRGWTSLFVSDARAFHIRTFRAGQRNLIGASMKMMALRNRYLLMIKNEILPLFLRDLPFIMWYDFIIFLYVIAREQTSLAAYLHVILQLRRSLRKRSRIQSSRTVQASDMMRWFQWRHL